MKLRAGTPEEVGMSSRRIQHVRDLAAGWVEDGKTPSLVVMAASRGVVVLHEAYGRLTTEASSPPLQPDSIFPIASITKPITATAAMALVEDGVLGLNRPVADYIPEFQGEGKDAVLVHHLLTHTSGLVEEDVVAHGEKKSDEVELPPREATQHPRIHEILFTIYDAPLSKKPGEEMSYCNFNYALLGEIVRRLSGMSLAHFAEERIFNPLGMNDTHYIVPDSAKSRIVRHSPSGPFARLGEESMMDLPAANGGVYSTAHDMAIFGQIFLNGGTYGNVRILSRPTVAAMTRNQIPGIGAHFGGEHHAEAFWGYGWKIDGGDKWQRFPGTLLSPETFNHVGIGGTFLWVDPTYELVGVFFSVAPKALDSGLPDAQWDLFANAVTAAIDD